MEVLIISRASYRFPDGAGGVDNLAWNWALKLAKAHSVTFVANGDPGPHPASINFQSLGLDLEVSSNRPTLYFLKGLTLALLSAIKGALVRPTSKLGVVQTHFGLAAIVLRVMRPSSCLVHTVHDPLFEPRGGRDGPSLVRVLNNRILEVLALKLCDLAVAVSPEIRDQIVEAGVRADRVRTIGATTSAVTLSAVGQTVGRDWARVSPSSRTVLMVGSLYGRKRVDLAIAALARASADLRLVVVGEGPKVSAYRALAASTGVAERVTFLGRVSRQRLAQLYSQADLFLLISDREGSPMTIQEAKASGLDTLWVDSGESTRSRHHELTRYGAGDFRVSTDKPTEIAQCLEAMIGRSAKPIRPAAEADSPNAVVDETDWDHIIESLSARQPALALMP